MKVCPSCAKENKDNAKFCTGCGLSLAEVTAVPGEPAPEPVPAAEPVCKPEPAPAPAPAQPKAAYVARTPAQAKLKELAGSKLALIICIAFTAILLCSICTSVFLSSSLNGYLMDGIDKLDPADIETLIGDSLDISRADISDAINSIKDAIGSSTVSTANLPTRIISVLSGSAVGILFAVSLWIIYGVAKKEDSVCCGTAGLKIIRVLRTIGLVLAVILAVLIALGVVFGLFMSIREGYNEATVALYVLAGVIAVVYIIMFCFLGGCISTLKRYISVSENRSGRYRISGFVRFILFVGGIFSVIGAIGWIVAIFSSGADMVVFAITSLLTAVYQFALSRFIGRSKKALKAV